MHRYVSSTIYNSNATKRSQMIRPDQLFKLPQDVYLDRDRPKSTRDEFNDFLAKVKEANGTEYQTIK